ncbi:MAG: Hsp20/alpha crystallin family protein [Methanobacteriota archaeon]
MHTRDSDQERPVKRAEPVMTLLSEEKFLCILLELPGITEERIRIDLDHHLNRITVVASNIRIQYKKVISIPCEVRFSKKRFSDGVLELTLEKTNPNSLCTPWL